MRALNFALSIALVASCAALALPVGAQPVLKDKEITEKNLIEALTPGDEGAEAPVRTRSIKIMRDDHAPQSAQSAAKQASASLLITFETNSADLTPHAKSSLDVVARALQAGRLADFKFSIEGHADPRGRPDDNLRLSQARAESVVDYLATHSINRDRLKPIGKGDTELANPQKPDAPENRRVTITTLRE